MQTLNLNGYKIAYRTFGDEKKPTIVLLHGNSSGSIIFEPQFVPILENYYLVAIDFYGHGGSELPENQYYCSVKGLGDQVISVINHLQIDQYLIYGVSLGGHVGVELIPRLKELKGIMISGTPPLPKPFDPPLYFNLTESVPSSFARDISEGESKLWAEACIYSDKKIKKLIAELIMKTKPEFRENLGQTIIQGIGTEDEKIIVETTELPIAIVQGENEGVINNNYVKSLSIKNLFNGQVHHIQDSAHYPNLESPEQFNSHLNMFAKYCFSKRL